MRKLMAILFIILVVALPEVVIADTDSSLKAAFVRNGDLYVKEGDAEQQVTHGKKISNPRWSIDGKWLAFLEGNQEEQNVFLYNLKTEKKELIFTGNASNLQWSPKGETLAFQVDQALYVKDAQKIESNARKITTDVGNYSWLPNQNGFLASTISNLTPDGWSDIKFYKVMLKNDHVKKTAFFELPAHTIGSEEFGIGTSIFKWSPDQKWISFIKYPTASMSADSNLLYVLSSDAKQLIKIDEMLNEPNWFQWAPSRNALAYTGGIGRMAIMNKFLNVKELPATKQGSLTPEGFVDRDFTWNNNHVITIARSKESEWSNNPAERPLPALYQLDLRTKRQTQITQPEKGSGDFAPNYVDEVHQLVWVRTNREKSNVWVADANGRKARVWIKKIDLGDNYYEKWDWSNVFSLYDPKTKKRTE